MCCACVCTTVQEEDEATEAEEDEGEDHFSAEEGAAEARGRESARASLAAVRHTAAQGGDEKHNGGREEGQEGGR